MSPITHFLAGWAVANCARLDKRERAVVTLSAVICDADGLGIVAEILTRNSEHPLTWWSDYHHVFGHNLLFGIAVALFAAIISRQRRKTAALAFVSFHTHILGDLIGARGPDGYQWPLPYLWPFSKTWLLTWSGQWQLNAWPNMLITAVLMGFALCLAWARGFSPLEMISSRADRVFVEALRKRFPSRLPNSPVPRSDTETSASSSTVQPVDHKMN